MLCSCCCKKQSKHYQTKTQSTTDEFIKERERYAEIGDDLDFAFVELIPGVGRAYNDRHPKPPSPIKTKEDTPPQAEAAEGDAAAAEVLLGEDGLPIPLDEDGKPILLGPDGKPIVLGEDGKPIEAVAEPAPVEPEVPKGPPPPPPPFDYRLDLPPEAAEVPFVRNYEPPPTEPKAAAAPAEGEAAPAAPVDGAAPAAVDAAAAAPADGAAPAAPVEGAAPAAPVDGAPAEAPAAPTEAPAPAEAPAADAAAPADAAPPAEAAT